MKLGEQIGKGTYGQVFEGHDSKGNQVAIKCYNVDTAQNGIDVGIMREIVYLKSLPTHPNIIRLMEVEWIGNRLRVAMPLYEIDLNQYVKRTLNRNPMHGAQIVEFSKQILQGLVHLHQHGIFIRDLKPANVLLNLGKLLKKAQAKVLLAFFFLKSFSSRRSRGGAM